MTAAPAAPATPAHETQKTQARPPAPLVQTAVQTALYPLHVELGARMVDFAGYALPLHYAHGALVEHLHVRTQVGLFDVSHMGMAWLHPSSVRQGAARFFERLCPGDIMGLGEGRSRYSLLTNREGGIIDDLIVTRFGERLWLVVNAACKADDFVHIARELGDDVILEPMPLTLLALQGKRAGELLASVIAQSASLRFMEAAWMSWQGHEVLVSRCGYTGEDGFEIALPPAIALDFARGLLAADYLLPCGLAARDSLRLEAGLCLYGQDIDARTTPIEARLGWVIPPHRRAACDFIGGDAIAAHLAHPPGRCRIGLILEARAIARVGHAIAARDDKSAIIGHITSGGFSPSLQKSIAMGYIAREHSAIGSEINILIRGRAVRAKITALPFLPRPKI